MKKMWLIMYSSELLSESYAHVHSYKLDALKEFAVLKRKRFDPDIKRLGLHWKNMGTSDLEEEEIYITYNSVGKEIIALDFQWEGWGCWFRISLWSEEIKSCDDEK